MIFRVFEGDAAPWPEDDLSSSGHNAMGSLHANCGDVVALDYTDQARNYVRTQRFVTVS